MLVPALGVVAKLWDGTPKADSLARDYPATVQVVVAHPLQQVLEMAFVRLNDPCENGALDKKVGKPRHETGVAQVHFEEASVSNMVPVEGYSFDERDVGDITFYRSVKRVFPERQRQRVVN